MINATNTGVKRELIPAGNYPARCYSMIHIGTVEENIMGEYKRMNKVRITWELPTELRVFKEEKGEQPMVISQEFTLSMNEKANLRKFLESWRGKGFTEDEAKSFDITNLLGVPCMLSVIHKTTKKGNEFETISSVASMPKGMECPEQINPNFEFNYDDKFDAQALESFPDFIKDKMKSSEEFKRLLMPENTEVKENNEYGMEPAGPEETNDLPF